MNQFNKQDSEGHEAATSRNSSFLVPERSRDKKADLSEVRASLMCLSDSDSEFHARRGMISTQPHPPWTVLTHFLSLLVSFLRVGSEMLLPESHSARTKGKTYKGGREISSENITQRSTLVCPPHFTSCILIRWSTTHANTRHSFRCSRCLPNGLIAPGDLPNSSTSNWWPLVRGIDSS